MSTESRIDLKKKVGIVLEKRKLFNLMVKVGAAFDVSGSTQKIFMNGTMQRALTRTFAIADKVDDNHTLDTWIFSSSAAEMPGIDPDNYETYAQDMIVDSDNREVQGVLWGGTRFTPFMSKIVEFYNPAPEVQTVTRVVEPTSMFGKMKALFGAKPKIETEYVPVAKAASAEQELPAFVIPFTDGENGDHGTTEQLLQNTADKGIFWQFVGVGDESFGFLKLMATKFAHVGFVDIKDLDKLSADALYEALITDKFADWIKKNYPQAVAMAGQQREQGK
jgi:hypothetical protein